MKGEVGGEGGGGEGGREKKEWAQLKETDALYSIFTFSW